jgi:hypothetical protein
MTKMGIIRIIQTIGILICVMVLTACSSHPNNLSTPLPTKTTSAEFIIPTNEVISYTVSIPIKSADKLTKVDLAQKLFSDWLDHFTLPSIEDHYRLDDYAIQKVELPDDLQTCANDLGIESIAHIEFSVQKSPLLYSDWDSGSGETGTNRWINKKSFYIAIFTVNKNYSFKVLGIPPCEGIAIDNTAVPRNN